ncbi:hypothetical protein C8R43DRAFT_949206 [Mycena crocata]|nr:hypothetical protein C8R43DRAFT_949206 [Mycena crocata]
MSSLTHRTLPISQEHKGLSTGPEKEKNCRGLHMVNYNKEEASSDMKPTSVKSFAMLGGNTLRMNAPGIRGNKEQEIEANSTPREVQNMYRALVPSSILVDPGSTRLNQTEATDHKLFQHNSRRSWGIERTEKRREVTFLIGEGNQRRRISGAEQKAGPGWAGDATEASPRGSDDRPPTPTTPTDTSKLPRPDTPHAILIPIISQSTYPGGIPRSCTIHTRIHIDTLAFNGEEYNYRL